MPRRALEIADIFREHGPAWRRANDGHVGLAQLRVMSAIQACRTEALGGHVVACADCSHRHVSYNSCKNRHCPKCQGERMERQWSERQWRTHALYGLLFKASAQTVKLREPCPDCGGPMRIVETFKRGERPTARAPPRQAAAG